MIIPNAARVITDRDTGRSRGFGFVNFSDGDSAKSALEGMDGQVCLPIFPINCTKQLSPVQMPVIVFSLLSGIEWEEHPGKLR